MFDDHIKLFSFILYQYTHETIKHSIACSIEFNIYDQEIAPTSVKESMFEQGTSEKAGPRTGKIDLWGAVCGLEQGGPR